MTINEAMRLASDEYSAEVERARKDPRLEALLNSQLLREYIEIDRELPDYVAEIVGATGGVPNGTRLPDYVYILARMCFRMGMRTQRKLDRPNEETSTFAHAGTHD